MWTTSVATLRYIIFETLKELKTKYDVPIHLNELDWMDSMACIMFVSDLL